MMRRFLTLRECVQRPGDAERARGNGWDDPIIPFIPEAIEEKKGKDDYLDVDVRVNTSENASSNNRITEHLRTFNGGPIEELILWVQALANVIHRKPVRGGHSKFEMAVMLLKDEPLRTFQTIRKRICDDPDEGGIVQTGETDESFDLVVDAWIAHHFPQAHNCPAFKQKNYMRSWLTKPRNVLVKQIFTRLNQMNATLPVFPGPENTMFSDQELINIVMFMIPQEWKDTLTKENFHIYGGSLHQVQNRLEMLELGEQAGKATPTSKKYLRKGKFIDLESPDFKVPLKASRDEISPKNYFMLCKSLERNFTTHTMGNCYLVKQLEKNNPKKGNPKKRKNRGFKGNSRKGGFKGGFKKQRKEMNLLIGKKVAQEMRKQLKQHGLEYAKESVDKTDSDEE